MCEYCGCRGVTPIAELMDEHTALVAHLDRHVRREERGVFRALRTAGDFVDEIDQLEVEHRDFAALVSGLDTDAVDFEARVTKLLDDLAVHVEREDLGIFPVSVTTLGASGWAMVDEAHTESPSFLLDAPEPQPPHEEESTCRRSH
jgi:iron-sulfur cluster repair protein YtfE (RIC family)